MREQDYMKIMNGLREDYISEAVNWDGTAQKNRRSIRRMSLGVGAIAAAMAVVVGGIGYGIYRDRLTANPQPENSEITIEKLNILGGHGELHGYLTTNGESIFRDNTYFYGGDAKWAIDGSTPLLHTEDANLPELLTDGEQIYTQHDGNVYITDSYGEETLAFSLGQMNNAKRIQKLANGDYFALGFTAVAASELPADGVPLPHTEGGFSALAGVFYHTATGKSDVIMEAYDTTGQNGSFSQNLQNIWMHQFGDSKDGLYYWNTNQDNTDERYHSVEYLYSNEDESNEDIGFKGLDFQPEEITGFAVHNDTLWFERLTKPENENGESRTFTELYTMHRGDAEPVKNYRGDYDFAANVPENDYPCYSYFGERYLYGVMQKQTDAGLVFKVTRHAYDAFDGDQTVFEMPVSELFGDQIPNRLERPEYMVFCDTEDYLFFPLPQEGANGELFIQVNLKNGTWFSLGENTVPQVQGEADITDQTDAVSPELLFRDASLESGYCSPEQFPQYYIPAENVETDVDKIKCYRMLPFAKASESALDTAALGEHLPEGGAWSKRDPDAPRMTFGDAFRLITGGSVVNGTEIMEQLCKLSAGYDAEAHLDRPEISDREFWLDDSGKDFFYVMLYSHPESPQDYYFAEFYYFTYDEAKKQYRYVFLPARSAEQVSGKQPDGTNFLGGTGTVHPYSGSADGVLFAEDDAYYYDLQSGMRAPKNGENPAPVFEPLPERILDRYYLGTASCRLMSDGQFFYMQEGSLQRINNDGTQQHLMQPDELTGKAEIIDSEQIRFDCLHLMDDDKLFVLGISSVRDADAMPYVPYLVDLKTNVVTVLENPDLSGEALYNYWEDSRYAGDCIYSPADGGRTLDLHKTDGSSASLDLAKDAGAELGDNTHWYIDADKRLWFERNGESYFVELDAFNDQYLVPQKSPDADAAEVAGLLNGSKKVVSMHRENNQTSVYVRNPDGSDAQMMAGTGDVNALAFYNDNGVYHFAVRTADDFAEEVAFITRDGISVSADGVKYP